MEIKMHMFCDVICITSPFLIVRIFYQKIMYFAIVLYISYYNRKKLKFNKIEYKKFLMFIFKILKKFLSGKPHNKGRRSNFFTTS